MQRRWQVWGVWLSEWLLDSLSMRQPSKSFAERARPGLAQVKLENLISTVAVARMPCPFASNPWQTQHRSREGGQLNLLDSRG